MPCFNFYLNLEDTFELFQSGLELFKKIWVLKWLLLSLKGICMTAHLFRMARSISVSASAITILFNGLVILFFVNLKHIRPSLLDQKIQMIQFETKIDKSVLVVEPPSFDFHPQFNYPVIPDIEFDEVNQKDIDLVQSKLDKPYEFPNKNNTRYKDVFDPKLRQKLIDAQGFNTARRAEKPISWTQADGRTFVDMGDGSCFVSMPKVDSRDRGTNWGATRCGKADSEEMMDNVMADFEARKRP